MPGDRRRWTWVRSEKSGFEGLVENDPADYWTPALSHACANEPIDDSDRGENGLGGFGKGTKTPRTELAARARAMRAAGMSYGEIAKAESIRCGQVDGL